MSLLLHQAAVCAESQQSPCLVQAVRQEEDLGSATDAIQAMDLLMKQGPDVGASLLTSDAAEALTTITLKMMTGTLFDSHR